jgi:hypothetical protein
MVVMMMVTQPVNSAIQPPASTEQTAKQSMMAVVAHGSGDGQSVNGSRLGCGRRHGGECE